MTKAPKTTGQFDVAFLDSGREPTQKPDPKYPFGVHVNLTSDPMQRSCTRKVPYPAPRCGVYQITCRKCGFVGAITVAGRPDDPSEVSMPCKAKGMN